MKGKMTEMVNSRSMPEGITMHVSAKDRHGKKWVSKHYILIFFIISKKKGIRTRKEVGFTFSIIINQFSIAWKFSTHD